MGAFDSNGARRRQCVALYKQWLVERSTYAEDLLIGDSQKLPRYTYHPVGQWCDRTGFDALMAFQSLVDSNPDVATFALVCSSSCRGKLCHGDILARELSLFLCAECA